MDSKDLKALFNLVLIILFVAATVLGPLIDRWRKKREAERRRLQGQPEEEPAAPAPGPAYDTEDRPKLPYENVLEEVFGPYIERRRRAAQEAAEAPPEPAAPEVDPDDEIRRMREARRPAEEVVVAAEPEEAPRTIVSLERARGGAEADAPAPARRARSLDEMIFRNPRLTPGAKLLLAAEILGKPGGRR